MRARVLLRLALGVVLAGALLAALAVPLFLTPGLATTWLAAEVNLRPTASIDDPLPGDTRVLAADGSLITDFYTRDRTPVTSDQIAPVMKQAIIDIEDSRFYQHGALDLRGTLRALVTDVGGGAVQGGSTLTQQLVKQTLVQEARTPAQAEAAIADTLTRKIVEAHDALQLEGHLSKDQILDRYLNTVYFGHGAYGVQSAARTYFSTDAVHLTTTQAATLAGLVQDPATLDPIDHPEAAQQRRDDVLTRMHQLGHLDDADVTADTAAPVAVQPGGASPNGCAEATTGGFFCGYLQNYLTGTLHLTQQQLDDGGLVVRTTLRPDLQRAGDAAVVATLPLGDSLAGIYTVVEPGTGKVLAMSVNRQFGCDGAGCTSVVLNDAAAAGSGSTYKVFTTADALLDGYRFDFTQTTSDPYTSQVYKQNGGTRGAPYVVSNAGHYPPTLNLAEALVMSSNTFFVGLEDHLGAIDGPVHTAQRMGLYSLTDADAQTLIADRAGSFTLGPLPTSPLALAGAYATVFSGGTQCDPTPVTAVLGPDGSPLPGVDTSTHCTANVLPAGLAHTMAQVMRGDVESDLGTATRANIPGHEISGKTGTSQNNFSVAFVGSTPEYTASVMVENPDHNQDVGGFGGGKGAQIWHDAMLPILSGQSTADFPPADAAYLGSLAHTTGGGCSFAVGNLQLPC
ncbi:transglycosylase domain-containing protein [Petropleomorpha daqingensis]|uniref:Membrane peptidoglycan carboxypeptidase n=1 Tax=Petropleomorpha daqingensis TaxID=2026353 RepID=A0A853CGM9_9ACTN|nr:transglycosylase domain-containing protein [Petropleomorpha daqingensis]NYJ06386.1 membrane peptidoglycan carboxypeptidase [Petropleomorpha daqingensis]